MVCKSCQICGKEGQANLMCTKIRLPEQEPEVSCWCVCEKCQPIFEEEIAGYYKAILE